ncbi:FSH1 [Candida pseudojiufengensis]|uniref:FSH1 n=1 Tax=Candida pseudojiufengensis TaxID=497109 RepID=UPI00222504E9|nr:FSH1 [Candida pseudojiufengensis]KAI5960934.1 FSH1 [Candida pseudojiufengensis]
MSGISKVLCLPGYLQSGATLARKSSGFRKVLSKKLNIQLDYISPCHCINSKSELGFPLGATEEEANKVWDQIVENENNVRWFNHVGPNDNKGLEESIEFILNYLNKNGPYDGIIGFSQGAAMAIMVTNCLKSKLPTHPEFKISMFVSGFCLTEAKNGDNSEVNKERISNLSDLDQYSSEVKISDEPAKYLLDPTNNESFGKSMNTKVILVYGKNDMIVSPIRSKYVTNLYNQDQIHIFPHEGAHLFPNDKKFIAPITDLFDREINKVKL